jgi:hypothetical protein
VTGEGEEGGVEVEASKEGEGEGEEVEGGGGVTGLLGLLGSVVYGGRGVDKGCHSGG